MLVTALDHVNIRTSDVAASVQFYVALLGLEPRDAAGSLARDQACWLIDHAGHAIIHLFRGEGAGGPTGAIHHVALRCSGKAEMLDRLARGNVPFEMREVQSAGMTQIFTRDPHGILLELTFFGE